MLQTDPAKLPPMPLPRFATKRDPSLYSIGPLQSAFARRWYRRPFLRWQDLVADVAGERLPSGRPRYGLGLVTVQRQAGKTDYMLTSAGERCMSRPDFIYGHTAQTGNDAQKQFLKFDKNVVQKSPLKHLVHVRKGKGAADMTFRNGSLIMPGPPTDQHGHGEQFDLYDIDEGWAFPDDQGSAILQAIGPTQLTRPDPQIRIWSAGGTPESTWLAKLVARGRAGDPSMFYFEWSIPDDMGLDDDELIASYHPAYGELIDAAAIAKLRVDLDAEKDPGAFARAAGNRWTDVIGGSIPAELWKSVAWTEPVPDGVPVAFGAARSEDGSQVAIVAAFDAGDRTIVEVCDILPTAYRAAEHVEGWVGSDSFAVDRGGSSTALYDELITRDNREPLPVTARDVSGACQYLLDALPHRGVVFRQHDALDQSVKIAGKRKLDSGGFVWAHTAEGQIAALQAATLAVWALRHREEPVEATPAVISA